MTGTFVMSGRPFCVELRYLHRHGHAFAYHRFALRIVLGRLDHTGTFVSQAGLCRPAWNLDGVRLRELAFVYGLKF
jgi:hypothetical protein